MVYARVHDQTVADDYYAAMSQVEKRLDLLGIQQEASTPIAESERTQLLALTTQLEQPELSLDTRLEITAQMRELLLGKEEIQMSIPAFLEAIPV
jgi:hypothetical protein